MVHICTLPMHGEARTARRMKRPIRRGGISELNLKPPAAGGLRREVAPGLLPVLGDDSSA